jgi:hypothetical protein
VAGFLRGKTSSSDAGSPNEDARIWGFAPPSFMDPGGQPGSLPVESSRASIAVHLLQARRLGSRRGEAAQRVIGNGSGSSCGSDMRSRDVATERSKLLMVMIISGGTRSWLQHRCPMD